MIPRLVVVAAALPAAVVGKPLPVAVEARFKERITVKLEASLSSATAHLAKALGVTDGSPQEVFAPHYELDLQSGAKWRGKCEADIDSERDSVSHCAIHKLQALSALCESGAAETYRDGILRLLKQLMAKREKVVPGLGMKRALLPFGSGIEVWMSELTPGSGKFDVVVPMHAAATLAVVQCGSALSEPKYFETAHAWFAAIEQGWPAKLWSQGDPQTTFHMNSILFESFVRMASMIRSDSDFAEDLRSFNRGFEAYLQQVFDDTPTAWSFSGAHATVLLWLGEKKKARKKRLSKSVSEYLDRWRQMARRLNVTATYTCGPLQGVAPLLSKPSKEAAQLVGSLLKMAEKDVDLFQVTSGAGEGGSEGAQSPVAQRLGPKLMGSLGAELQGAFIRDSGQMEAEKRQSLRIDDTAQCVSGLTRTLALLDTLVGADVPEEEASGLGGAASGVDAPQAAAGAPTDEL